MNAPFSDLFSSSRSSRIATVFGFVFLASAAPLLAQAPAGGGGSVPAPVAPAGVGATAPTAVQGAQAPVTQTVPAATIRSAQSQANENFQGVDQRRNQGPAPLSEFQQLVAGSTGTTLPIFGSSLFSGVPSTFAPVNDVPVSANYVLGPGDTLSLQLSGQINQQYELTVDRTGAIVVPSLGAVHVAGVPYSQLSSYLHDQFSRLYRNFNLNVNLGSLRTIQVFVVGEARSPGTYSVSSLSTLLNAVFASGGPLPSGSLRDIQVKRDGKTLVHFDLYDLLLRGDKSADIRLLSGDVIFIPFAGPQVAVAGSVNTPAIYELKGASTIAEVLQLAGGETAVAGGGAVRLERIYEHSQRSIEDVSLATAGSQVMQNGDIVSVSSIVQRFRNAVTLRGNVASPGRFVWRPGLRISDLIPNKEALITRNYWDRQNQLGQLSQDYLPNSNNSAQSNQGGLQLRGVPQVTEHSPTPARTSGTGSSTSSAATTGSSDATTASEASGNGTSTTSTTGSNNNGQGNTSRNNGGVEAGGNSVGASLTANNGPFTAQNDVILNAPDIDWSYAVIERLSTQDLKTSLIPFNLGKLVLDGDPSQNFELQPNDVVTIFSTADIRVPTTQQTRYVRLEGEFLSPGVYSVLPGETLRSLLRREGGFTPEAYLFASEFTRESTRRVEGQRLREYADQLDAQISSVTATGIARAISAADQSAAAASADDARSSVARLRNVTPTGRIVLDLKPISQGIESLPDLALEDGDRFVVPRVPSSITVEGQVYNANAFVYTPNRRMLDYLHRAGGPDREADRKREFVLRADGSVISNQYSDVRKAPVFPGDTLVVPPILDRRGIFQRIVDVSSIVTNFGFSAATLYLLGRD
ncbi:MAG: SLBB domain-containing protein [Janthinobacterium lividum]